MHFKINDVFTLIAVKWELKLTVCLSHVYNQNLEQMENA